MMIQSNGILVAVLSTVCALPALSQDESRSDECGAVTSQSETAPQTRTRVTWVQGPDGKRTAVETPVKEMKVVRLIFVGNTSLPLPEQEQIAKSITEHDYDDDQEGLDELLERARDAWLAHGYFKASVELSGVQILEEDPERRTMAITVKINAGKQYRLEEIRFAGGASSGPAQPHTAGAEFSPEQLRAFFPIKPGDIFNTHKLQVGVEELRKAYGKKGYINFAAVPTFNIDETSDGITLIVDLDEGKQFHIGKIQVVGADPPLAQELMKDSRLAPGRVIDAYIFENLKLPKRFRPEDDVERRIDETQGTVDLTIILRPCP